MGIIATPLGWIMKGCYYVVSNYGIALLLFTILTRLITFPLQIKQQKSTARMTMLQPELEKLKKKYGKNQQKLQEEQMNLYSQAGVNPMASCLPMVITMVILFALIPVIYGPLTYISSADKSSVEASNSMISNLYIVSNEIDTTNKTTIEDLLNGYKKDGSTEEEAYTKLEELITSDDYSASKKALDGDKNKIADVMNAIKLHNDIDKFMLDETAISKNLVQSRPELMTFSFVNKDDGIYADVLPEEVRQAAEDIDYQCFGLDMGVIPSMKNATAIIPILSFVLQLAVTVVSQIFQKKNNPDMAKNMGMGMKVMLFVMPVFSLWIGFSYPAGLGLYWCYSSLFALGQTVVLNVVYTPAHVAELVEKDMAKKKKSGKKTMMERMAEAQLIQQGKDPAEVKKQMAAKYNDEDEEDEPKKKSKSELQAEQRRRINEARKRMAEKYGEEYDENVDDKDYKKKTVVKENTSNSKIQISEVKDDEKK